jgi:hypothetical protein
MRYLIYVNFVFNKVVFMVKLFLVAGALSFISFSPAFSMDNDPKEDATRSSHAKKKRPSSSGSQREDTAAGFPTYEEAIESYKENQKDGLRALGMRTDAGCIQSLNLRIALGMGLQIDTLQVSSQKITIPKTNR